MSVTCPKCGSADYVTQSSMVPDQMYCSDCVVRFDPLAAHEADDAVSRFDTGAVRSTDANGVRYDLVGVVGLRRLAETYAEGATKYGPHNWRKGFPFSDLLNHLIKHVEMFKAGDATEDHLAHAAWGLFTLMDFQETMPEMDDRYRKEAE